MPKDIKEGIKAGFTQYLTKPIRVEMVVNTIKDVLESQCNGSQELTLGGPITSSD